MDLLDNFTAKVQDIAKYNKQEDIDEALVMATQIQSQMRRENLLNRTLKSEAKENNRLLSEKLLQLQNLNYEKSAVQREISQCRKIEYIYPTVLEVDEEDDHETIMEKLNQELNDRIALDNQLKSLQSSKAALEMELKEQAMETAKLDTEFDAFIQSSIPLQARFGLRITLDRNLEKLSEKLCPELLIFYQLFRNHASIDPSVTIDIIDDSIASAKDKISLKHPISVVISLNRGYKSIFNNLDSIPLTRFEFLYLVNQSKVAIKPTLEKHVQFKHLPMDFLLDHLIQNQSPLETVKELSAFIYEWIPLFLNQEEPYLISQFIISIKSRLDVLKRLDALLDKLMKFDYEKFKHLDYRLKDFKLVSNDTLLGLTFDSTIFSTTSPREIIPIRVLIPFGYPHNPSQIVTQGKISVEAVNSMRIHDSDENNDLFESQLFALLKRESVIEKMVE